MSSSACFAVPYMAEDDREYPSMAGGDRGGPKRKSVSLFSAIWMYGGGRSKEVYWEMRWDCSRVSGVVGE